VAVAFGDSRCGTGVNGASWGEQDAVGLVLGSSVHVRCFPGLVDRRSGSIGVGSAGGAVSDVAVDEGGSGHGTGNRGTSWGELDGVRGLLDHRLEFRGEQGRSVEQTTRSNERVCTSSCNSVCWALDRRRGRLLAWVAVSEVVVSVWVLDVAQVVVFRPFASGVVAVVDGDVAVAVGGSGSETRG
jgi:hypothetical protein